MVRPALGTTQGLTYSQRSIEMLKKLLVTCFALAAATAIGSAGCGSSSSDNKTGTAGGGGHAGTGTAGHGTAGASGSSGGSSGTAGAAGSGTAGAGTAGAGGSGTAGAGTAGAGGSGTAGAGGGTAGAGGGTAGAGGAGGGTAGAGGAGGGGTAGAGGAGGAPDLATIRALCTAKETAQMAATPFSAADFCALYEADCGTMAGAIASADCMATYTGWAGKMITSPPTDSLQSCVSYHLCNADKPTMAAGHCPHAAGGGPCAHN
jgi:hypothetical protein